MNLERKMKEALDEEAPEEGPNELENEEEARENGPRAGDDEETRKAEVMRKAKEFTQLYRASQEYSDLRAQEEDEAMKAKKDEERRRREEHNEALRASLRELEDSGGGSQTKTQSALTFGTPRRRADLMTLSRRSGQKEGRKRLALSRIGS